MSDTPEEDLWLAVVSQAVVDATAERPSEDRDDARKWLLGASGDFGRVCRWAGLDPDDVRENAERLAARGLPTPPTKKERRHAEG
jgi:hypothetical protein